jgi:hypothetical protein
MEIERKDFVTVYYHQIFCCSQRQEKKMGNLLGDVLKYPLGIFGFETRYLKS